MNQRLRTTQGRLFEFHVYAKGQRKRDITLARLIVGKQSLTATLSVVRDIRREQ